MFLGRSLSHAYLRSSDNPGVVVHVLGSAQLSTDGEMVIRASMLDYERMMRERTEARVGGYDIMGNEKDAVLDPERAREIINIPYSAGSLAGVLGDRYPELGLSDDRERK